MKRISKESVKTIAIVALAVFCFYLMILNIIKNSQIAEARTEVIYQPAEESLAENGFYPGRVYGDYTDLTFCFDDYLKSIGAEKIERFTYMTGEGKIYELRFEFDGFNYCITTTEFKTNLYNYGLYSRMEAKNDHVTFAVPTENSGTYIADATSPFKVDWLIFDVFHAATDKDSDYVKELRAGLDETNCPFNGLGVAHYEKANDGTVTWHDDLGEFTFDDGLDLHY